MKVSKENCSGCPAFEDEFKENMVKNDICPRRSNVGCWKEEEEKQKNG